MGWKPDWEEEEWEREDRMAYLVAVLSLLFAIIVENTLKRPYPEAYLKQDLERVRGVAAGLTGGFEDEHLEREVLERFSGMIDAIESEAVKGFRNAQAGRAEWN
jgi:hypothetical protein